MNRPSQSTLIVTTLALVFLALVAWWLVPRLEYYTDTIDLGFSTEAYQNPYLAAQQYLQKLGKTASSSDSLESMRQLPDIDTALVIDDISQVLSEERTYELLEWVRSGGRLVMGARGLEAEDTDYVLEAVGLEVIETDCDCRGFEEELAESIENLFGRRTADKVVEEADDFVEEINEEAGEEILPESSDRVPEDQLTLMDLSGLDEELQVHFDPNQGLYSSYWSNYEEGEQIAGYEPVYWAGSLHGEHLVQFEIGAGHLTVLSDESIWFSENLVDYDHAYLLWGLLRHSEEIMFVYGSRMPGLFTLLWRNAKELVISGLLFLIAWLIYKGRRFGPVLAEDRQHRRALIEHQHAVGQFVWQRGQASKVIAQMQTTLKQLLEARYPGFGHSTREEQETLVTQALHVPAKQFWLAITPPSDELNAELFTKVTAAIQLIRNRL